MKRITVPEAHLRSEVLPLAGIFGYYFGLEVVFIIADAPPDLQPTENDMKVQERWELERMPGGSFFWNYDRSAFDFRGSKYVGGEALYRLIEEASEGIREDLAEDEVRSFEIRPVFAVRK